MRRRRPAVIVQAHHPQGIEFKAGAFEYAEHLNRRRPPCFSLKDTLAAERRETAQGLAERQFAKHGIEPGKGVEHLAKGPVCLEIMTGERAFARPGGSQQGSTEQRPPLPGPRAARGLGKHRRHGLQGRLALRTGQGILGSQPLGKAQHALQADKVMQALAHRRIDQRPAIRFADRGRPATDQQQGGKARLLDFPTQATETQQIECRAHQR